MTFWLGFKDSNFGPASRLSRIGSDEASGYADQRKERKTKHKNNPSGQQLAGNSVRGPKKMGTPAMWASKWICPREAFKSDLSVLTDALIQSHVKQMRGFS